MTESPGYYQAVTLITIGTIYLIYKLIKLLGKEKKVKILGIEILRK